MRFGRLGGVAQAGLLLCALAAGCADTTLGPGSGSFADQDEPAADAPETDPAAADASDTLSVGSLPTPAELGAGWSYAVDGRGDPGRGDAAPALERDPVSIMSLQFPDGCAPQNPLPVPAHSLEVRYAFREAPVTAYRLTFPTADNAVDFFELRLDDLDACRDRRRPADDAVIVSQVIALGDGLALSNRYPGSGDRSVELSILDGRSVVLLQAGVGMGTEPFTSARVADLADSFRR